MKHERFSFAETALTIIDERSTRRIVPLPSRDETRTMPAWQSSNLTTSFCERARKEYININERDSSTNRGKGEERKKIQGGREESAKTAAEKLLIRSGGTTLTSRKFVTFSKVDLWGGISLKSSYVLRGANKISWKFYLRSRIQKTIDTILVGG